MYGIYRQYSDSKSQELVSSFIQCYGPTSRATLALHLLEQHPEVSSMETAIDKVERCVTDGVIVRAEGSAATNDHGLISWDIPRYQ